MSTSTRAPRLRSTSSTRPTTIRYTPRSKNNAVTNLIVPSTGTSIWISADDNTGAPTSSDAAAGTRGQAKPSAEDLAGVQRQRLAEFVTAAGQIPQHQRQPGSEPAREAAARGVVCPRRRSTPTAP